MSAFRQSAPFQAILLGAFALAAAASLASGHLFTGPAIEERLAEDLKASIGQVIPANLHTNDLLIDKLSVPRKSQPDLSVYQAQIDGAVTAVAFEMSGFGYAGEIRVIMGIDREGQILGARVLSHAETPGLGDKIEAAKDDWILSFDGLSFGKLPKEKWGVKKDGGHFDQFSGATITPRAVVSAVKHGLEFFDGNKELLLTPVPDQQATKGANK